MLRSQFPITDSTKLDVGLTVERGMATGQTESHVPYVWLRQNFRAESYSQTAFLTFNSDVFGVRIL